MKSLLTVLLLLVTLAVQAQQPMLLNMKAASGGGNPNDPGTPTVLWAKLNSTSGSTIVDSSSAALNGFIGGTPNWVSASPPTGLTEADSCSSSGGYGVTQTNAVYNLGTGSFYISAWVNFSSSSSFHFPLSLNDAAAAGDGAYFEQVASLYVTLGSLDGSKNSGVINDGNWHNLIISRNGSTTTYYVDGSSLGTATGNAQTPQFHTSVTVAFGQINGGGDTFTGLLSDVRIDNKALTAGNVTFLQTNP